MIDLSSKSLQITLRFFPNFLWPVKRFIVKKSLAFVGENFHFSPDSVFLDHKLIRIGNNVFMGQKAIINTIVPVVVGNNVMFGPEVMIMGGDHNFSTLGKVMREVKEGGRNEPVIIEDDVWIGARAIILKGVTIGEGAVVGAGSVVTRNLPPYSISVGNPCKTIKYRFSQEELKRHLTMVNSKYTLEVINQLYH